MPFWCYVHFHLYISTLYGQWVILTQDRDVRIDAKMKLETSLLQAGCGHGFFLGAERAILIILLNWVLIFHCFNAHWLAAQILPKYCSCLKRQRVWSVVSIWMKFFFPKQTQQTISKMGTKKYGFQHVPNHPPVWLWFSALYSHYIAIT